MMSTEASSTRTLTLVSSGATKPGAVKTAGAAHSVARVDTSSATVALVGEPPSMSSDEGTVRGGVEKPSTLSFEAIVSEHGPYLWRVLRRLGVRAADIEDVWQETFIVVHRKLDSFEGRASVRTWMSAIAVRVASDYRNRAHRRHEQATDSVPESSSEASQQDELMDRERKELLDRLIAELKPEQRDVIVLYEFGELPMQEVAEALGCPLQTAYSRLHAARKALELAARRESARRGSP